jgi:beta-lactamase class C
VTVPKLIGLAALALLASCSLPAATPAVDIRGIVDTAIRPVMAEYDVPGMAVAVTIDGRSYFFNYGVASRETRTPVSEQTLFELGSVSKTFTATLASYAQVLGELSLDDRPGTYMPQLQGSAIGRASLINLGTYTAGGLPLQFPDGIADDARMIGYFRQWEPDAAPGTQRRYSNPSIGLLGHVTALALERDFADAVEGLLLPGLGLGDSYVRVPERAMDRYAWGYGQANTPIRVNPGMFAAEAYGIKSTAADMIRFVQANIDPGRVEGPMRRAIEGTQVGYFILQGRRDGAGSRMEAVSLAHRPGSAAGRQLPRDHHGSQSGDAARSPAGAVRAHAVQQDRLHGRVRRVRGVRAGEEDRHRDAGEPQLPYPRARRGGAFHPGAARAGGAVASSRFGETAIPRGWGETFRGFDLLRERTTRIHLPQNSLRATEGPALPSRVEGVAA